MSLKPETLQFLQSVEQSIHRKLQNREEVGELYELAKNFSHEQIFDELTFHAKFLARGHLLLRQFGTGHEETNRLAGEFSHELEKAKSLIESLLINASDLTKRKFNDRFIQLSHETLNNFLSLMADLALVKDYALDHKEK